MFSTHRLRRSAMVTALGAAILVAAPSSPASADRGAATKASHGKPSRPPASQRRPATARAAAAVLYSIQTLTGSPWGAGTDGDVWVRLNGTSGTSSWIYLDNANDNFERYQTDGFSVWWSDLGSIGSVDVWFSGTGSDWFLDYVRVNGALFPAYRWMPIGPTNLPRA
jgi:PLAT/LH2 domain